MGQLTNMRRTPSDKLEGYDVVTWDAQGSRWGVAVATLGDMGAGELSIGHNGTQDGTVFVAIPSDTSPKRVELIKVELETINRLYRPFRSLTELKAVLSGPS